MDLEQKKQKKLATIKKLDDKTVEVKVKNFDPETGEEKPEAVQRFEKETLLAQKEKLETQLKSVDVLLNELDEKA